VGYKYADCEADLAPTLENTPGPTAQILGPVHPLLVLKPVLSLKPAEGDFFNLAVEGSHWAWMFRVLLVRLLCTYYVTARQAQSFAE
jgi:hypothetical protein